MEFGKIPFSFKVDKEPALFATNWKVELWGCQKKILKKKNLGTGKNLIMTSEISLNRRWFYKNCDLETNKILIIQ